MSLAQKTVTLATSEASRANGRKSNGPVTDRGRQTSRLNALKHWGRAESMRKHMPALGEAAKDYAKARRDLYEALGPRDPFEVILVDGLADIHWRLGRMIGAESAAQGERRLERKAQREQDEAAMAAGKMGDIERFLISKTGLDSLKDSPLKFEHILGFLQALGIFLHEEGFKGEGVCYLQMIYGVMNPGLRGKHLIDSYQRGAQEEKLPETPAERLAANRARFLASLKEEIERYRLRTASDRRVRADLEAPRTDAEILNTERDPARMALYQERLERVFARKWRLLEEYREKRQAEREPDGGDEASGSGPPLSPRS